VYGEQSTAFGTEHDPVPEQEPAPWKIVGVVQLKPVHITPDATWAQAPLTQKPVLPQVPFGPQRVCGSASGCDVPTGAHVPCPLMLQAWQTPQLGEVQQTPSTQLPLVHS